MSNLVITEKKSKIISQINHTYLGVTTNILLTFQFFCSKIEIDEKIN